MPLIVRAHTAFDAIAPARGVTPLAGSRQQLTGTLLDEDGHPVGGQTVQLQAELAGTRSYRTIRAVRTGASGSYTAPFALPRSAKVKLVYAGSRIWQPSSTKAVSIAVRPSWACKGTGTAPTVLHCASSPKLANRVVTARFDARVVAASKTDKNGLAAFRATAPAGQQLSVTLRGDASYAQASTSVTVPTPAPRATPVPRGGGTPYCYDKVIDGSLYVICPPGR